MLQITILGCSSSLGVPLIGCDCAVCKSSSEYNKRTRSSIFIDDGNSTALIDFGYDIKNQLIRENIRKITGAILTHQHADHVSGIDDLRIFSFIQYAPLEIFTDSETAKIIEKSYGYLFANNHLKMNYLDFFANFAIGSLNIQLFRQHHGVIDSLGIRIGDFVYSSDVSDFPEESVKYLQNIKIWVVDCFDYKSNQAHSGLDKIFNWNKTYNPEQIFLTNLSHYIDYYEISKILPSNIKPLYDGYKINI
jgi:phosphoribosyl 1,2-cyclic phosphate phosphodiesterase